jgi:flagellar hook protein FlgE
MLSSYSTALSGLNAMSDAIDIVGNNLSNLNTTGYKESRASFKDLVAQASGDASNQIGLGTGSPLSTRIFSQGTITQTQGPFDAAINGDGFFVVKAVTGETEYTRDGSFSRDKDGFLVTSTGEYVQGWSMYNGVLSPNGPLGNIQIPVGQSLAPRATTEVSLSGNLDASAQSGTAAGTFKQEIQVIDSLGNYIPIDMTFTRDPSTTTQQWDYSITAPSLPAGAVTVNDPNAVTTTDPTTGAKTTTYAVQFDSRGDLISPKFTDSPISISLNGGTPGSNLPDGSLPMTFKWSLWNTDGTPRLTQFSESSAMSSNSQDGQPAAQLIGVSLANDGKVVANYSNGAAQQVVAQLAVASVRNPESLLDVGNNNYSLSSSSANPAIGTSGTGGRGTIDGSSLEGSTVDIASEFSNLLLYQRSYQANSRVVTVSDQLAQEAVNLVHS